MWLKEEKQLNNTCMFLFHEKILKTTRVIQRFKVVSHQPDGGHYLKSWQVNEMVHVVFMMS
jgi:hypothetical protein